MNKTKMIITSAMLAAMSIVLHFVPGLPTQWGMNLDLIAVPWLMSLFLLGGFGGALTAVVSTLLLSLLSSSGWLGMLAKFLATLPFIVVFAAIMLKWKKPNYTLLGLGFIISVVIRAVLMVYLNYYFFLPIWMNMPTEEVIANFPAWVIIIPNTLQSIIDFGIAGFIVYGTKLRQRINA